MMRADAEVQDRAQDPVVFHLTGKRPNQGTDTIGGLRPALLAPYRDLASVRYDFPVVLVEVEADGPVVRSLSSLIDELLQRVAPPGPTSEQLRRRVLRLEREIRTLVSEGAAGRLSELWDQASARLASRTDASFGQSVWVARAALEVDGPCVDCDAAVADHIVGHIWNAVEENKARTFRATVSRMVLKLDDILRAEFFRSTAGRSAASLQAAIGAPHQDLFDFAVMSDVLPHPVAADALPEARRRRIEWALWVLKRQRFFAPARGQGRPDDASEPYGFRFDNCAEALAAFRSRLQDMVDVVKAMSIAELEINGRYVDSHHDAFFERFDAGSMSADDMAAFPDYLVVLGARPLAADNAGLLDALSSGLPLKIVVNIDDVVEEGPPGDGHFTFGLRSAQLASIATGLGEVFVLQSTGSNLCRMRDRVLAGLTCGRPALFSVFTGVPGKDAVARYLSAAAAMQSRAFPAFTYDPTAGADMASRFSLENNPQVEADWTVETLDYADDDLQRTTEKVAFTFLDFLAVDPRYARHFIRVSRSDWSDRLVPADVWLARGASAQAGTVPFVWLADSAGKLGRVVADDKAVTVARRCLESWHRLQELGGVNNSYATRLLAREKAAWEEQRRREDGERAAALAAASPAAAAPAATAAPVVAAAAPVVEEKEPERSPDEPYIETSRCSSCNECIQVNDKMFAYNENKQAYIANPDAGTYRQLVEAAENCQIGVIHPGKPRNKSEPDLDELMKRAEAFA